MRPSKRRRTGPEDNDKGEDEGNEDEAEAETEADGEDEGEDERDKTSVSCYDSPSSSLVLTYPGDPHSPFAAITHRPGPDPAVRCISHPTASPAPFGGCPLHQAPHSVLRTRLGQGGLPTRRSAVPRGPVPGRAQSLAVLRCSA